MIASHLLLYNPLSIQRVSSLSLFHSALFISGHRDDVSFLSARESGRVFPPAGVVPLTVLPLLALTPHLVAD